MENICKDQVEEIVEFEQSGEPVESTINTSKGCAEKIDIPAADHQFQTVVKSSIVSMAREMCLGLAQDTLQCSSQSMQEMNATWSCRLGLQLVACICCWTGF